MTETIAGITDTIGPPPFLGLGELDLTMLSKCQLLDKGLYLGREILGVQT